MNIEKTNSYQIQNITFEHKFPREVSKQKLQKYAYKISQSKTIRDTYEGYVQAIKDFKDKRVDVSDIVAQYIPTIIEYGKSAQNEFRKLCRDYKIPQKQPLIYRLFRKPNIEHDYDWQGINIELCYKEDKEELSHPIRLLINNINDDELRKAEVNAFFHYGNDFSYTRDIEDISSHINNRVRAYFEDRIKKIITDEEAKRLVKANQEDKNQFIRRTAKDF